MKQVTEETVVFKDRVALVTGAAGNIGLATVRLFAEAGVRVAATDLSEELVRERTKDLVAAGYDVRAYAQDVTDREAVFATYERIVADFGKIDILVNNAGAWDHGGVKGPLAFETIPEEQWVRNLRLNVEGTMRVTQAVLPHMLERGYGRIVNLGSIAGITGIPGNCDYSASKGALGVFTRTLAMETAKRGVTVNSVAPGWIERTSRPIDRTWIGRCGEPKDIARAILFFADDEAGYITGTELPVDGGRILGSHGDDM